MSANKILSKVLLLICLYNNMLMHINNITQYIENATIDSCLTIPKIPFNPLPPKTVAAIKQTAPRYPYLQYIRLPQIKTIT